MRNHQILCVKAKYTDSISLSVSAKLDVFLLHRILYLHENTAYSSKKQGKNTVGTVFSPYAQALKRIYGDQGHKL